MLEDNKITFEPVRAVRIHKGTCVYLIPPMSMLIF